MRADQFGGHPEQTLLRFVRIDDETAIEDLGSAGHFGYGAGQQSSGATLRDDEAKSS